MKKRLLALGLISAMALSLVACGDKKTDKKDGQAKTEDTAKEGEVLDCTYNVDDYVTLGDYKGIEVTLSGDYEYSEEGLKTYIDSEIADVVGYMQDDTQTTIAEDSIVNVDYVGSQDGVAFDGGSAENQLLDVKNNCSADKGGGFIDGFTAGLVGHKVGEEVAYEVTFPEQYQSAALAGQTVIFTFQVNYIAKKADVSSLNDENVNTYFADYKTIAEFNKGMEEAYKKSLEEGKKGEITNAVINAVCANATVKGCPENLLQGRIDTYVKMMESYLNGHTFEEYITSSGSDYDEYMAQMRSSLEASIKQQMIFEAITKAENLTIDTKEYDSYVADVMTSNNMADEETFYSNYAIGNLDGKKYFQTIYLADKAIDYCVENAVVNE